MSLNEVMVEDATLEWFGERVPHAQAREIGHGPRFAPGEPAEEGDSFGEVEQFRHARTLSRALPAGEEAREAIRRLNPAIPTRTLPTLRATLLPQLLSGSLQVNNQNDECHD